MQRPQPLLHRAAGFSCHHRPHFKEQPVALTSDSFGYGIFLSSLSLTVREDVLHSLFSTAAFSVQVPPNTPAHFVFLNTWKPQIYIYSWNLKNNLPWAVSSSVLMLHFLFIGFLHLLFQESVIKQFSCVLVDVDKKREKQRNFVHLNYEPKGKGKKTNNKEPQMAGRCIHNEEFSFYGSSLSQDF